MRILFFRNGEDIVHELLQHNRFCDQRNQQKKGDKCEEEWGVKIRFGLIKGHSA